MRPRTHLAGVDFTLRVTGAEHVAGDLLRVVLEAATLGVAEDGQQHLLQQVGRVAALRGATPAHHRHLLTRVVVPCGRQGQPSGGSGVVDGHLEMRQAGNSSSIFHID